MAGCLVTGLLNRRTCPTARRAEARQRRFVERSKPSGASLALFDQEVQWLTRVRSSFANDPEQRVVDSWGWDEQLNPEPFRQAELNRREG